jgi:hypothetical protein
MNLRQRIILTAFAYPLIVYAIAFLVVCLHPYWYDDSPNPEYLDLSDRWGWALALSLFYSGWGLPFLFAAIGIMMYLSKPKR